MTLEAILQGSPNTIPFIRYPRGPRPKTYHTIHFPEDFDQIPSFLKDQGVQAISYALLISRPDIFLCEEDYNDTPFPLALLGLETQLKKGHRCIVCGFEPDVTERAFKFAMQRHLRHVHFLELGKTRRQVLATSLAMEREEELNKVRRADELELRKQVKRERRAALRLARKEEKEVEKLKEMEHAVSNEPTEQTVERESKRIKTSTPAQPPKSSLSPLPVPVQNHRCSSETLPSTPTSLLPTESTATPAIASSSLPSNLLNLPAEQQAQLFPDFLSPFYTFYMLHAHGQSAAGRKRKFDMFLENSQPESPPKNLLDDYSSVLEIPDWTVTIPTQSRPDPARTIPPVGSVFDQGVFSDDEVNKWMNFARPQGQDFAEKSGVFPAYDPSPFFLDPFFSSV
ncbi:hypothetical protein DL96DRAFT_1294880 [Flagelloscypha sp. PMI_526]|nr:hypothetical protein DL96DRAFT_1294880 [Flagelloscypha sp. PMI_526]